jgi:hypothetical protein
MAINDQFSGYAQQGILAEPMDISPLGDFGRGLKYSPFDLLGAPVDLMNMGLQGVDALFGRPNTLGSRTPFLGSEYLIDKYSDLVEGIGYDYGRPTGSLAETAGRVTGGILAPTGGAAAFGRGVDLMGAGIDAYAAGAPARVAERARTTTLGSGVDPTAFIDDMIVRGMGDNGGVSPADTPRGLLDQTQAAQGEPVGLLADDPVRQMDTAQARYFETGKFEPPTAENVDQARAALEASPNDPVLKQQYLDLRRVRDTKLSQMSPTEQLELDTNYRMQHQPRGPQDGGGRLDDITAGGELFPDDVYSADGLRFYGNPNNSFDRQSYAAILSARGNPEAEITIYRGVPTDVNQINAGDWVTLSPDYAAMHAADGYGPNGDQAGKVISQQVKVKDVFSDGNDLNEFGYFPADLAELGVKKIVPPTPDEPGIIAFHGSGADFDEFRLEMIGTGEGAQAYGYGLYFTDSEDIARFYKDAVGGSGYKKLDYNADAHASQSITDVNFKDVDGYRSYPIDKAQDLIKSALKTQRFNVEPDEKALNIFEMTFERDGALQIDMRDGTSVSFLKNFDGDELTVTPLKKAEGKIYKVGLAPKPDELLDYDLPLSQQPRPVQKQIENLVGDLLAGEPEAYNNFDFQALAAIKGDTKSNWMGQKIPPEGYSPTGDDLLRDLKKFFESQDFQNELYGRGDRLASELMTQFGIPGIKYRASGSRGAATADEAAERNYVIFDDKAVNILEKYGIAGPVLVTGAGMAREEQPRLTRGIL